MNFRMQKILVLLLASKISFGSCQELFNSAADLKGQSVPILSQIQPEFRKSHNENVTRFTELPPEKIHQQGLYGSCWLHAFIGLVEHDPNCGFNYSTDWMIYHSLVLKFERAMEEPKWEPISEGGFFREAMQVANRFGVVPEKVWTGNVLTSQNGGINDRLLGSINEILFFTMNQLKSQKDPAKIDEIKSQGFKSMLQVLSVHAGPLVKSFTINGKTMTPKEFAVLMNFPKPTDFVQMSIRSLGVPVGVLAAQNQGQVLTPEIATTPLEEVEEAIKNQIDKGQAVYLGYRHRAEFTDKKTGIMSVKAWPKLYERPSNAGVEAIAEAEGNGHAVLIIGYLYDENGRLVYKIQNSWGEAVGDRGYYYMYPDYFKAFMKYVYINRNLI